jgi:hypothetical protein
VDLQGNVVTVRSGSEIDIGAIPRRVHESGFEPGEMRLSARGTVEPGESGPVLRIAGWRRAYPVAGALPEGPAHADARVLYATGGVRLVPIEAAR